MSSAWKPLAGALAVAGLAACSHQVTREIIREQPVATTPAAPTPGTTTVTVLRPPPAVSETPTPQPGPGYSWIAGHHEFRDGGWTWVPGQWVAGTIRPMPSPMAEPAPAAAPSAGARWIPGYWTFANGDWAWVQGRWLSSAAN